MRRRRRPNGETPGGVLPASSAGNGGSPQPAAALHELVRTSLISQSLSCPLLAPHQRGYIEVRKGEAYGEQHPSAAAALGASAAPVGADGPRGYGGGRQRLTSTPAALGAAMPWDGGGSRRHRRS
ncbi:hypothetical protein [Oryza sativa Japonica Group]|uniref:Uncharacterized protein n=1 Tax=Oryza sativa subsp. japonica TaxID=39947 RepID=Q5QME0_ORYSJ|nr:hypothetical protein [Oryza sativa Japonica Group]